MVRYFNIRVLKDIIRRRHRRRLEYCVCYIQNIAFAIRCNSMHNSLLVTMLPDCLCCFFFAFGFFTKLKYSWINGNDEDEP